EEGREIPQEELINGVSRKRRGARGGRGRRGAGGRRVRQAGVGDCRVRTAGGGRARLARAAGRRGDDGDHALGGGERSDVDHRRSGDVRLDLGRVGQVQAAGGELADHEIRERGGGARGGAGLAQEAGEAGAEAEGGQVDA